MSVEPLFKRDTKYDMVIASLWPERHCLPALDWIEGSCEI